MLRDLGSGSSRMSGYKRGGSSSDEYKLSRHKIEVLLQQQAKVKRPGIPIVYLVGVALLLPILIILLHISYKILGRIDYTGQIFQKIIKCSETSRKAIQIMTDELSCSLLIKEVSMHDVDEQHQVLFGTACLALLAPYSVAPGSTQSMLMYYRQHRDGLVSFQLWMDC
ncbi:hypothetical protein Y032_0073g774 [Ancylostoma ceylanicum]|uniref:Uncharacterized protein n=1 Tax=Ancylostoma ceylanicum TaxID=53326 RepID=A0A016TVY3_9BILA|nr:hypothetical protein Y032_0073g774 [Ancylostoma ceylanicum]